MGIVFAIPVGRPQNETMVWDPRVLHRGVIADLGAVQFSTETDEAVDWSSSHSERCPRLYVPELDKVAARIRWRVRQDQLPRFRLIRPCLDCGRAYVIQLPWRRTSALPIYCPSCSSPAGAVRRCQQGRSYPDVPSHWSRVSRGHLVAARGRNG